MKINYNKSCYSESIQIIDSKNDIVIISGLTSHANVENHISELQELGIKLLNQISEDELNDFYRSSVSEDYEASVPSKDMVLEQSNLLFSNLFDPKILFLLVSDLIQMGPNISEDESYSCEGCGDTNYSYAISL